MTQFGGGKYGRWSGPPYKVGWSDSTSGIDNTDDESFTFANTGQNAGVSFTVPADTTLRTIGVLWGGATGATITLSAHLSDGSAADYSVAHTLAENAPSGFVDAIVYNAAKPGQTLTITLTKTDATPDPSVDLAAAWLY